MWTRLDPTKLFGSIITPDKNDYYRITLPVQESNNPKHSHILKYGTGCFFVIKAKTRNLRIRYRVHFRRTSQEYYPLKWGAEVVVFAKINDQWEILNHWQDSIKNAGGKLLVGYDKMSEEQSYELYFDISRVKADTFQICLPSQGKILNLEVDCDNDIEQIYEPIKIAIAGSSIAAGSADSPAHSLPAMAYRKYGINIANCGISGDHTFNCIELMQILKQLKIKVVVMDLLHISEKTFLKYYTDKQFIYYIVTPVAVQYERFNVLKYINDNSIAHISGEGHLDITHLNSSGISYYLKQLNKRGII